MVYVDFIQNPQSCLAALLAGQLPENLQQIYFVNSGTESVEGALKAAKKYTGKSKFIAFRNSYHGDTHGSLSVTGRRSEEHTSELQSRGHLVCRLLLGTTKRPIRTRSSSPL